MAQNDVDFSIDPSGDQLMDDLLEPLQENINSSNSGTSRPSYAIAGTVWIDVTTTPWVWKMFNGTNDVVLGEVDVTLLVFTPSGVVIPLDNFAAGAAPTVGDDEADGYSVGSRWYYDGDIWLCVDATAGSAVWVDTGVQLTDLGSAALLDSIDEDDMSSNSATKLPTQQSVKAYVDTSVAGIESAGRVLLATYTPTAGLASVDITSVLSSTYDEYEIECSELVPQTDNVQMLLRTSSNNSTFDNGASDYTYHYQYMLSSSAALTNFANGANNEIQAAVNISNNAGYGFNSTFKLKNINSTTGVKSLYGQTWWRDNGGIFRAGWFAGARLSTTAVNALQLIFGSGNFAAGGKVRVYGIKK